MKSTGIYQTEVHEDLLRLKEQAFDLTAEGALTAERLKNYRCDAAGLQYHFGTQRLNDETLNALQKLADQTDAVKQYKAMLQGEVINKIDGYECENRQVLHTAVRNVFADLNDAENIGDSVDAIKSAQTELDKVKKFCEELNPVKSAMP